MSAECWDWDDEIHWVADPLDIDDARDKRKKIDALF